MRKLSWSRVQQCIGSDVSYVCSVILTCYIPVLGSCFVEYSLVLWECWYGSVSSECLSPHPAHPAPLSTHPLTLATAPVPAPLLTTLLSFKFKFTDTTLVSLHKLVIPLHILSCYQASDIRLTSLQHLLQCIIKKKGNEIIIWKNIKS